MQGTVSRALPLFRRRRDDRVLAGVAGGFAAANGVDPFVVRTALVVSTFAGGIGAMLYAVGLLVAGDPEAETGPDGAGRPPLPVPVIDPQRNLAVGCITAGLLLAARAFGLWPGDALMLPVMGIGLGLAVVGTSSNAAAGPDGDTRRGAWGPIPAGRVAALLAGGHAKARMVAGALLIVFGLLTLGGSGSVLAGLRNGAVGAVFALSGAALVFGPWLARLVQQLGDERRERIRSEERASMAAHLHDSVLQTLALIQRNAHDPRRTVTLARRQERELREWLYRSTVAPWSSTLQRATATMAEEVEDLHDVKVELVVVGDRPLDDAVETLLAAAREAAVNAAKHAGVDTVSVYVEVDAEGLHAYVRDRGKGFDPEAIPPDRRGVAASIRGRISRAGGIAEIESAPGEGTEVRLFLPLAPEASS
jgi:phage shock protein PspC (stress-responsive transcriptional regulator)/two-component sensor histidine kinase